ncbi:hypothetical protein BSP36_187 [Bacillus phage BSP36]|nr:hypothetical protein BSP36_187 [Bacillus phage BSP36]
MTPKLTISARELSPTVTYRPFTKVKVNNKSMEEKALFLVKNLREEVMKGTESQRRKKIKQMKRLLKLSLSVLGVMVGATPKSFAVTTAATATNLVTPAIVMQWGLTVAMISVSVGVALSMSLLTLAGIYRMMRKRKEAEQWTTDIIRGLVQVLVAVPVVYLLFYLAQTVFKSLPILSGLF